MGRGPSDTRARRRLRAIVSGWGRTDGGGGGVVGFGVGPMRRAGARPAGSRRVGDRDTHTHAHTQHQSVCQSASPPVRPRVVELPPCSATTCRGSVSCSPSMCVCVYRLKPWRLCCLNLCALESGMGTREPWGLRGERRRQHCLYLNPAAMDDDDDDDDASSHTPSHASSHAYTHSLYLARHIGAPRCVPGDGYLDCSEADLPRPLPSNHSDNSPSQSRGQRGQRGQHMTTEYANTWAASLRGTHP
ncbi:hypothetical protein COCMIDRAFT_21404 [Bipolaris oryzae ATCC 44560]|uniref:Uncharacterized protein n=1 Tax=Bipolaris oryzae ATCC 44560 TaxID=930090 RepID=W6ZN52_COCMI|nr:uncharacterized protein COCMIDRAFT_21404 [Bipolaris oryzae ATCC 44560]EUC51438.1 hypothetical protein COCMIDRAFT_21404 [Bipolaris oryzae ATCC 44560]